jgi:hypothetical protein
MLTILLTGLTLISLGVGFYYRHSINKDWNKYQSLVRSYQTQYPDMNLINAYIKALILIIKCKWIIIYQSYTSIVFPDYIVLKYVTGGKYQCCIIPIKRGPKPQLEYGYIDHVNNTELINQLSGIDHDFSSHPEFLLGLGNHIRYKFIDQDEIILEKKGNENKKQENLKKINNFYMNV